MVYDKCFKFVSLHFRWVSNVCFPDFIIVQNYHTDSVHRYPHPPHFKMFIAQNSVEREHSFSKSFLSLVIFLQRKTVHIREVLSIKKIQGPFGNLQHAESSSASVPHQNHGTKKNDFFFSSSQKRTELVPCQMHKRESNLLYTVQSHFTSQVLVLEVPKTTPRFDDSLGGHTGLSTQSPSWLWLITMKAYKTKSKRGQACQAKFRGKQRQAPKSPLPVESYGAHNFPSKSCDNMLNCCPL